MKQFGRGGIYLPRMPEDEKDFAKIISTEMIEIKRTR